MALAFTGLGKTNKQNLLNITNEAYKLPLWRMCSRHFGSTGKARKENPRGHITFYYIKFFMMKYDDVLATAKGGGEENATKCDLKYIG